MRPNRAHHDGVAVGRALGGQFGRDIAPGAAPIVDHERLSELLAQRGLHRARDDVRRAAGGEGDEDANRARRILLGRRGPRDEDEREQSKMAQQPHDFSSL